MNKINLNYVAPIALLFLTIVRSVSADTYITVPKVQGSNWSARMEKGVTSFAEDTAIYAYMHGQAEFDVKIQAKLLEELILEEPDVLAVVPIQTEAIEPQLAAAQKKGILVVTHEAPNVKNASYDIEPFIHSEYGQHLMDSLARRMKEEGDYVVFVGSLKSESHKIWANSAIDYQKKQYPKMKQIGSIYESNDDAQVAEDKMNELLKKYPSIKGVQGSAALDVIGVGRAIEAAKLQDQIVVVGTSMVSDAKELLKTGAIDMISGWDPAVSGYAMNEVAKIIREGKIITDGMDLGLPGYEKIKLIGKVIYASAWIDVSYRNMDEYDY